MASVVGKTIFSDGKGKLFFGYYKTDDAVEFVDYKTWKKLSFKDVSKGDTNKERVIKAILKNQKQFNKKVDFNMWAKKQKRSFEDTMDWFIQNGWISNINKGGIKESVDVLSVNEGQLTVGDTIKIQSGTSLQKMNVTGDKWKVIKKDNSTYTLQKLGSSMKVRHPQTKVDYLIVRPGQSQLPFIVESVNEAMKPSQVRSAISKVKKGLMRKWKQKGGYENFGQKELSQMKDKFDYNPYGSPDERQISKMLDGFNDWAMNYDGNMREGKKRFKRQDGIGKAKYTISYHDGKKKHKDGSDFFDIKIFKNKKDLSDFVGSLVKQGYKLTNESVNEDIEPQTKKIASLTGTGPNAVKQFVSKHSLNVTKLLKFIEKGKLKDRLDFVAALAGRDGTPIQKKVIKMFSESVNEAPIHALSAMNATRKALEKRKVRNPKTGNDVAVTTALKDKDHPAHNQAKSLFQRIKDKLMGETVAEDKGEVEKIKKQAGNNEIKFYDALSKVEKRLGSKYPKFLDTALKQLKQNPSSFKTNADKEEKLFQLVK